MTPPRPLRLRTIVATLAVGCCSFAHAVPPGEIPDLSWCAGTTDCLAWTPDVASEVYTVYRGDGGDLAALADGAVDSSYVGAFVAPTTGAMLIGEPPVGDFYWYLVTGSNADGEGDAGTGRVVDADGTSCGDLAYREDFSGLADGSPWPAPWTPVGSVDVADIQSGAARFRPTVSNYSLARLHGPLSPIGERDVEVTFTFEFEDTVTQGVGFYVRSNGGYLNQTTPAGQGYAVFVEGFRTTPGIGVWKEQNGSEIALEITFDPALAFTDGVRYRVRFRVNQNGPTETLLQARVWPEGSAEPAVWHVEHGDSTAPELQGVYGDLALDSWSNINPGTPGMPTPEHTLVDDIEVVRLCNPLAEMGSVQTVEESFLFAEGPLWVDDRLLFTDLDLESIYSWGDAGPATTWRAPSDGANGLALDVDGQLLAAEHATRRVSRTHPTAGVSTVAELYQGQRFNSPNDLAVRGDGTIYFTDPPYGLPSAGDRELPFNGLFRIDPGGAVHLEWAGDADRSGPNGVALSPGERRLYVADSEAGTVTRWDVAVDGTLSAPSTLADGLVIPDGLAVDRRGNLYVATWGSTVEVFSADGVRWGAIPVPRQATNVTFGGADGRTLWITAHEGLYRVEVPIAGAD